MSDPVGAVVQLAAATVAIGVLLRAATGIYRFVRRIDAVHEVVVRELQPNGGSSLRDAVARIDRRVHTIEVFCDELRHRPASD